MSHPVEGDPTFITLPGAVLISGTANWATPAGIEIQTATAHGLNENDVAYIQSAIDPAACGPHTVIARVDDTTIVVDGTATMFAVGAGGTVISRNFGALVPLPDDLTDPRDASSVNVPFEACLDRASLLLLALFQNIAIPGGASFTSATDLLFSQNARSAATGIGMPLVAASNTGTDLLVTTRGIHGLLVGDLVNAYATGAALFDSNVGGLGTIQMPWVVRSTPTPSTAVLYSAQTLGALGASADIRVTARSGYLGAVRIVERACKLSAEGTVFVGNDPAAFQSFGMLNGILLSLSASGPMGFQSVRAEIDATVVPQGGQIVVATFSIKGPVHGGSWPPQNFPTITVYKMPLHGADTSPVSLGSATDGTSVFQTIYEGKHLVSVTLGEPEPVDRTRWDYFAVLSLENGTNSRPGTYVFSAYVQGSAVVNNDI